MFIWVAGCWLKGKQLVNGSNIVCTVEYVDQKWKPERRFFWETPYVGEWRLFFLRQGVGPQTEFGTALGCIAMITVSAPVAESICNDYRVVSTNTATVLVETLVRQAEYLGDSGFWLGSSLVRDPLTSIAGCNWGENMSESRLLVVKEDLLKFVSMLEYLASLCREESDWKNKGMASENGTE